MSAAQERPRLVPLPVDPLDDASRALVPKADLREGDERTFQRDEDLPSTEPDGAANELARVRDSVLSGLRLLEDARNLTPRDMRVPEHVEIDVRLDEPPTIPARETSPSDVFAPLGAKDRILDEEAATPRDRPFRHLDHDKPTDLDPIRVAPTVTNHLAQGVPVQTLDRTEPLPPRHVRESDRERQLVLSVYDSERAFLRLKDQEPDRAAHVVSLQQHLNEKSAFGDRDVVLAQHLREKLALKETPADKLADREDRVMALALVAHELDDRFRAQMAEQKDQLLEELGTLPADKRDAVFEDFETFAERGAANDSNFCRRELHKALKHEEELHKAYVYALALDKQKARVPADPEAETVLSDEQSGKRRRG